MPRFSLPAAIKPFLGQCVASLTIAAALLFGVVFFTKGLTATGVIGTHGSFTVGECSVHKVSNTGRKGGGPHSTHTFDCTGTFRADDGKFVDGKAAINDVEKRFPEEVVLPAQKDESTPGGGYLMRGSWSAIPKFLGAFTGLLIADIALFFLLTGVLWKTDGSWQAVGAAWRATKGTATRVIVLVLAAAAVFGLFVVSPVLGAALKG
ncbi:hypothetical protein [Streptomyces sp. x-80]|jgi:hypothetical protein|uniref:hypothetical protein n=1 Tax=Streptomyces sp. x-80 TaxID=2789282 RepID=UPI00398018C7